jgi:hypothetical protein
MAPSLPGSRPPTLPDSLPGEVRGVGGGGAAQGGNQLEGRAGVVALAASVAAVPLTEHAQSSGRGATLDSLKMMAMGLHKRGACASEGVIMQFSHGAGVGSALDEHNQVRVCVCVRARACPS